MISQEEVALFTLERVEKEARVILELLPNGEILKKRNPNGKINVLAVIGPGLEPLNGCPPMEQVLLAEVGFYRTKPYNRVRSVPYRPKQFVLAPEQYELVGTHIWAELVERVEKAVEGWEYSTFNLPVRRDWLKITTREIETSFPRRSFVRGLSFSLDQRDKRLFQDLCWAEFHLNPQTKKMINWLAKFIEGALSKNKKFLTPQQFQRLKGYQVIQQLLAGRNFPPHLLPDVLMSSPVGKKHPHIHNLAESDLFSWDLSPTEAMKMRQASLPGQKERLRGVQARIRSFRENYVVFEILPRPDFLLKLVSEKTKGDEPEIFSNRKLQYLRPAESTDEEIPF